MLQKEEVPSSAEAPGCPDTKVAKKKYKIEIHKYRNASWLLSSSEQEMNFCLNYPGRGTGTLLSNNDFKQSAPRGLLVMERGVGRGSGDGEGRGGEAVTDPSRNHCGVKEIDKLPTRMARSWYFFLKNQLTLNAIGSGNIASLYCRSETVNKSMIAETKGGGERKKSKTLSRTGLTSTDFVYRYL